MALNGDVCGNLIKQELEEVLTGFFKGNFDMQLMQDVCNAIGTGVVKHIQQSGVVTGTCSTGPITGKVL